MTILVRSNGTLIVFDDGGIEFVQSWAEAYDHVSFNHKYAKTVKIRAIDGTIG